MRVPSFDTDSFGRHCYEKCIAQCEAIASRLTGESESAVIGAKKCAGSCAISHFNRNRGPLKGEPALDCSVTRSERPSASRPRLRASDQRRPVRRFRVFAKASVALLGNTIIDQALAVVAPVSTVPETVPEKTSAACGGRGVLQLVDSLVGAK